MKSRKTFEDLFAERHLPLPASPLTVKHYASFEITTKKVRTIATIDFTDRITKHALAKILKGE